MGPNSPFRAQPNAAHWCNRPAFQMIAVVNAWLEFCLFTLPQLNRCADKEIERRRDGTWISNSIFLPCFTQILRCILKNHVNMESANACHIICNFVRNTLVRQRAQKGPQKSLVSLCERPWNTRFLQSSIKPLVDPHFQIVYERISLNKHFSFLKEIKLNQTIKKLMWIWLFVLLGFALIFLAIGDLETYSPRSRSTSTSVHQHDSDRTLPRKGTRDRRPSLKRRENGE